MFILKTALALSVAHSCVCFAEVEAASEKPAASSAKLNSSWFSTDGSQSEIFVSDKKYKITVYGGGIITKWKQECLKEKSGAYTCQGGAIDNNGVEYDLLSVISISEDGSTLVETWKTLSGGEAKANGKTIYKKKPNANPVR